MKRRGLQLLLILASGLTIRLLLAPYGMLPSDIHLFRAWAIRLVSTPLAEFYASDEGDPAGVIDHLPGDLWILWVVAHLYQFVSPEMDVQRTGFLVLLKLVPSLADVGIGALLFAIVRRMSSARAGVLAAACVLFNPAVIFVSATWGQWDSVSAAFMLLALWPLVRGKPEWSLPPLTYASLIKPQFALLVPLVLLAWWIWRMRPAWVSRHVSLDIFRELRALAISAILSIALFLLICLPFSVGAPLTPVRWTIVDRARVALDQATVLSRNAFNLWGVVAFDDLATDDRQPALLGLSYQLWGTTLLIIAVVIALALFWHRPQPVLAIWAALAIMLALFVLLTRMHERYLLPAVILAILLAALEPMTRWIAVALSLTWLINLVAVYELVWQANRGVTPHLHEPVVFCVSAVNVMLLIAVYVVGFRLATDTSRAGSTTVRAGSPTSRACGPAVMT